jgi:hypothetical protein
MDLRRVQIVRQRLVDLSQRLVSLVVQVLAQPRDDVRLRSTRREARFAQQRLPSQLAGAFVQRPQRRSSRCKPVLAAVRPIAENSSCER